MKKNIIANVFGKFWGIISGFLFVPLYIHYLGFDSYSIISFTLIISGLMVIFDAGLTASLSREFARTDNSQDDKRVIYRTLETCYFIIVIGCILLVFFMSQIISLKWLNTPLINNNVVSLYVKIFSFDIGFQLLFRFYLGGLLGLEKQIKANIYQVLWGVIRNGVVVLVIMNTTTLKSFFVWQSLSTIIFTILLKISLDKIMFGKYSFNIKLKVERYVFAKIWKFAGGMMLISVVGAMNTQLDKLVISKLLSLDNLGYYTLAVSLASGIMAVASPFSTALLPRFTSLYSEGKCIEASNLFQRIGSLLSLIIFSLYANMFIYSEQLFFIWTGSDELAAKASIYLPLISFSYSMLALAFIPFSIAIANGYTKINNLIGLASLFITLPGYWFATKYYGAAGAAFVFCCVQTTTTLIYFYFINKKFIKIKLIKSIYIDQIIKPALISVLVVYLLQLIPFHYEDSRLGSFIWIGVSTLITLVITFFVCTPNVEIKKIFESYI